MSWHLDRLAAFDVETTGPEPTEARIVTAAISVNGGGALDEPYSWLIDPGVEIPEGAIAVHGITNEKARAEGAPPAKAIGEILEVLTTQLAAGVPIVAFNARFDMTILDREARRHGLATLDERVGAEGSVHVIDPHVLDKQIDRYRKGKRTLTAVCEHYGVIFEDAHTAVADAVAAAAIARCLGEKDESLRALCLADLHSGQIAWAAEQAQSLQDYFQRQGREEQVEGAWPLIPFEDSSEHQQAA